MTWCQYYGLRAEFELFLAIAIKTSIMNVLKIVEHVDGYVRKIIMNQMSSQILAMKRLNASSSLAESLASCSPTPRVGGDGAGLGGWL